MWKHSETFIIRSEHVVVNECVGEGAIIHTKTTRNFAGSRDTMSLSTL